MYNVKPSCKSCKLLTAEAINHSQSDAFVLKMWTSLSENKIILLCSWALSPLISNGLPDLVTFEPRHPHAPRQPWNTWLPRRALENVKGY